MGAARTIARPVVRSSLSHGAPEAGPPERWWQSTFVLALAGQAILWAAFPPVAWSLLAWLASVPWVVLIRRPNLAGRRPYLALWLSSFVFWLAAMYWLTLPHWALAFGWLAMSFYLAFYFAAFIALSRVAVHTLGISPIVAAPTVWTGLELARAYILGGFAMASLAHTQYRWPELIQTSDIFGGYGVSFLMVFVGACLARILPVGGARRAAAWPLLPLAATMVAALAYGHWRTTEHTTRPGPKVALIQGSVDIDVKYDPAQAQQIFDEYFGLSQQAVASNRDLELIVWPETMFREPWYTFETDYHPAANVRWKPEQLIARSRLAIEATVMRLGVPCLLGVDTVYYKAGGFESFNTALFTDRKGKVQGRYDKCHLVPFGEYMPLGETFPWLYQFTPLPGSSTAGSGPMCLKVGQARYAVNICYENTLGHMIRGQVVQLRSEDREPDVLVNLTNDGWFWGSSELDLHLACAVFRAVECRKPFLVAANTGFSASIDSNGRIVSQARRRATDVIIATPAIDSRGSWYLDHGDSPAGLCCLATIGLAFVGLRQLWTGRKKPVAASG